VTPASLDPAIARELVQIAEGAARSVGPQLRAAFQEVGPVSTKRDFHDVVTDHDRRAEETIRAFLQREAPDSRVCGEELGVDGEADLVWYVDPIDGTNNFISGIPFFCVSIGAVWKSQLAAGVIYDPLRPELFAASAGGAFCNGVPLAPRGASTDREAMLLTSYPTHRRWEYAPDERSDVERFAEMVTSFRTVRRLGSAALALAYVAAGRAEVVFHDSISPWDVAAGILLIRCAGGVYIPLPPTAQHRDAPWLAPSFLAHVKEFDLQESCLAPIARARPGPGAA